MPSHPWLEALGGELARRGLPPAYVARFVRELDEHIQDLLSEEARMRTETETAAAERLGEPEVVAEQAVTEFRRSTFAGRHPVWMFLIAPVPALILTWALFVVVGACGFEGVAYLITGGKEVPETDVPLTLRRALYAYFYGNAFVPPALVTLLWCRLARRSGRGLRWGLTACLLIAVVAGSFIYQLTLPTPEAKGTLMLGLGIGRMPSPRQMMQFAAPLVLAAGYVWWAGRAAKAVHSDPEAV